MDIVLVTRNTEFNRRPLLEQTLESLFRNALYDHNLIIVDDASDPPVSPSLTSYTPYVFHNNQQLGVGGSKNRGAASLVTPTTHEELMFVDDDFYFLPGWDHNLEVALHKRNYVQLGGWSHPFNKLTNIRQLTPEVSTGEVGAVTGVCQVMMWDAWKAFGPFPDNAKGPGQSEDFALSQKIKKLGGRLECIQPFVGIHCGLTNSAGKAATGAKEMEDLALGQIKEHSLEGKVNLL